MTAEEAATKRVGDPLNLDGTDVRVTLVDESRVYHIEGEAPEGVEVGDVAHYFNAGGGEHMVVVSWTGDEVECYHGVNLSQSIVAAAFNVRLPAFSSQCRRAALALTALATKVIVGAVVAIIVFAGYCAFFPKHRPPAVIKTSAPPSRLMTGSAGRLQGKEFRIQRTLWLKSRWWAGDSSGTSITSPRATATRRCWSAAQNRVRRTGFFSRRSIPPARSRRNKPQRSGGARR